MSTVKYTVPNWYQSLIARAAGLDPNGVSVGHEDDTRIKFLQYQPRAEIVVEKTTGEVRIV